MHNQSIAASGSHEEPTTSHHMQQKGYYNYFHKYGIFVLLLVASFSLFNEVGCAYFLLLLIHGLVYFAFRISDSPIDNIIARDSCRKDFRSGFCYAFVVISFTVMLLAFLCLIFSG